MAKNRIEEFHPCWRLETETIDDDLKRAAVSLFPKVEAYNRKPIGLVECQDPGIVVRPKVKPVIHRPLVTARKRLRDQARVAKRAHEYKVRKYLPPQIK